MIRLPPPARRRRSEGESPHPRPVPKWPQSLAACRLSVESVTATYREGGATLTALRDVSLHVEEREFVALIGPSGSGKSTLLDIVAGLTEATSGTIVLDGIATPVADRLGRCAYMRQRDLLLPWRTTVENAALGLEASGTPRRQALTAAIGRLTEFGLDAFANVYPSQLSGGMRQRVAFLRTVLLDRSLLLLDEPFGALDALTRAEMQDWLLGLWEHERRSVLLVTHDVDEAIFLADRVVVLTPRPGQPALERRIDLPRPRRRAMVAGLEFADHRRAILGALRLLDGASA